MNALTYLPTTLKRPTPPEPIETLMHALSVKTAATNDAQGVTIVTGMATVCRGVVAEEPDINLQTSYNSKNLGGRGSFWWVVVV
jgi:hypothetical protein